MKLVEMVEIDTNIKVWCAINEIQCGGDDTVCGDDYVQQSCKSNSGEVYHTGRTKNGLPTCDKCKKVLEYMHGLHEQIIRKRKKSCCTYSDLFAQD
jgi:hypothetical protein